LAGLSLADIQSVFKASVTASVVLGCSLHLFTDRPP
jgi:hypothetical protein